MEGHAEQAAAAAEHGGHVVATLMALLVVAILVGIVARRLRFPYTVALVLVGVALHAVGVIPDIRLTEELLMTALLPALLFEAAIHIPGNKLKSFAPSIATLAVPGVMLAIFATAFLLEAELTTFGIDTGIPFVELLLFGAMIAATDPISVVALFKQLGVEKRLAILVEGESLFNDGTAVVVFGILLEVLRTGEFTLPGAVTRFVVVAAGGMLIGAAIGLLASWATSLFDDHLIEIALTVVTAYGAFLLAEQVHVSGVLATVIAGLLVGNVGKKTGMSPFTRVSVLSFWEFAAFFINSLVFLLLGLEVDLPLLVERVDVILLAFVAVLVARAVAVLVPMPLLRRLGQPIDARTATVLWWGGLRGSLSVVLALALPATVTARNEIVTMTFGVVLLSVVLQGATMKLLLARLGLTAARTDAMRFLGTRLARLQAVQAERSALEKLALSGASDLPGLKDIEKRLEGEREQLQQELRARRDDPAFLEAVSAHAAVIEEHLKNVSIDAYRKAYEDDLIDGDDAGRLIAGEDLETTADDEALPPAPGGAPPAGP